MCKINSLFKLIITSILRNNCVPVMPVRNKSLLFLILNLPLRVRAILFIITESSLYLRPVASLRGLNMFLFTQSNTRGTQTATKSCDIYE